MRMQENGTQIEKKLLSGEFVTLLKSSGGGQGGNTVIDFMVAPVAIWVPCPPLLLHAYFLMN